MLTPNEISSKEFERAGKSGYRSEEVDSFLAQVSAAFSQLIKEKDDLEKKIVILAEKIEEYRKDEDSLRAALLGAQRFGDNIVKESKNKAEITLRDAQVKADKLIGDSKKEVERQQMLLAQLKVEVSNFRSRILSMYKSHIEFINSLPVNLDLSDAKKAEAEKEDAPAAKEAEENTNTGTEQETQEETQPEETEENKTEE